MLINVKNLKIINIFFSLSGFLNILVNLIKININSINILFVEISNYNFKFQNFNNFLIISNFKLLKFINLNFKIYKLHKISFFIMKFIPNWIYGFIFKFNKLIIYIKAQNLYNVINFLKKDLNLQFKSLMDIWTVDFPENNKRFELNYMLLCLKLEIRIIIKIFLSNKLNIDSLNKFYNSSIWLEREIWDMFGIFFKNHFDLRRILTDYGFYGYPLRKDFPLSGYIELRYNDIYKYIVVDLVEFSQELRVFNLLK